MTAVLYGKCGGSRFDVHVRYLNYRQLDSALASSETVRACHICGLEPRRRHSPEGWGFKQLTTEKL